MQGKRRLERQHTSAMPSCAALCAPATWVCVARMQPGQLAIRRFKLAGWPLLRPCRASALLHMDMAVKHDAELGMVRPASFGVHLTNNADLVLVLVRMVAAGSGVSQAAVRGLVRMPRFPMLHMSRHRKHFKERTNPHHTYISYINWPEGSWPGAAQPMTTAVAAIATCRPGCDSCAAMRRRAHLLSVLPFPSCWRVYSALSSQSQVRSVMGCWRIGRGKEHQPHQTPP